jgi:septal ring factor EnvC (AmiA/AmiB activator)
LRGTARGRRALVAIACLLASLASHAQSDPAERLERLRQRLDTLQQDLNTTRGRRDVVRDELFGIERRMGALVPELKKLDARWREQTARLDKLKIRAREERRRLAAHRAALARQVRTVYALGAREELKLFLSQDDPARLARLTGYHRALQRVRVRQIEDMRESLARLERAETEVRERTAELATVREHRLRQKAALEQEAKRRGVLVTRLTRTVRNKEQELDRLKTDRERLERLVREIRPMLDSLPPVPAGARFGALAGRLPLPVRGAVVAHFNDPKPLGNMRWRGLFLAAREGDSVRAVARGRVVYADTLRGFGLLLILDHGDGYMSLYGHNQSLLKEVGNWVEAGESVSVIGSTGDAPRPGLYFEIRHQGQPQDPLRWCVASAR